MTVPARSFSLGGNGLPDRQSVLAAEPVIRPYLRTTPIVEVDAADFGLDGRPITFKLEFLQHAGSFKARGAMLNLLTRGTPDQQVVAASGGNHGVAVAYAANRLGRKARIYVPAIASPAKVARIKAYGAEVVVGGERYADALAASQEWAKRSDALEIHAFDQVETLVGQGTVALEFHRQAPGIETLLVAVGGGGLIGGMAAYCAGEIRLVAVEPDEAPTLSRALAAGRPVDAPASGIAADSLAPRRVGELAFPLAQAFVSSSLLVTDEEIVEAQLALWNVLRVVVEPGGATAFAALLSGRYRPRAEERVGVLLAAPTRRRFRSDRTAIWPSDQDRCRIATGSPFRRVLRCPPAIPRRSPRSR